MNRNVVARISHNEYKDVLLNNKYFRGSMNRIQHRNHKIKNWNLQPISLSCLDDKISILNNGCDGLALGCWLDYNLFKTRFNFQSCQNSFFFKL